jgi:sporulation protein YqfD
MLHVTVRKQDFHDIYQIADKEGASVKILQKFGAYWLGAALAKRPVLLLLICILLLTTCYVPSRILFISVEGNHTIPTNLILEVAENCGIQFGTSRRQVRSEVMKNALLEKIPQLQWAGINTYGCVAVIRVREKTVQSQLPQIPNQVCSIIASRDGIIQSCIVRKGNPLCSVGQAVKAGETLVSGYTDCGIITTATKADAEIRALTFREIAAVSPVPSCARGEIRDKKVVYSLRIGKKLIKFYKDSGISDTTCAKIYMEECLQLPGGFQLPFSCIKEMFYYYDDVSASTPSDKDTGWLPEFAENLVKSAMVAGEIISAQTEITSTEDACYLSGKFACIEMIGRIKYEQTILKDGRYD